MGAEQLRAGSWLLLFGDLKKSSGEVTLRGEVTKDETWSMRPRGQQLAKITGMK